MCLVQHMSFSQQFVSRGHAKLTGGKTLVSASPLFGIFFGAWGLLSLPAAYTYEACCFYCTFGLMLLHLYHHDM